MRNLAIKDRPDIITIICLIRICTDINKLDIDVYQSTKLSPVFPSSLFKIELDSYN